MKILVVKPNFAERLQPADPDVPNDTSSSRSGRESRNDLQLESSEVVIRYNRNRFPCLPLPESPLDLIRMAVAELVGTFILMFSVCGIIAVTEILNGQVGLLEYAAAGGLSITTVIFCIGPISGAHVNPAFTLAFAVFGHFSWIKVPIYVSAQISGSMLATVVAKNVYGVNPELVLTRPHLDVATAFWIEFIGTYIIMFLAASMLYNCKTIGHLSGIVIGICIALMVLITGPVSGGSLNPARSLGPAIVSGELADVWIYCLAPCSGAIFGALTYRFLHLREEAPSFNHSSSSPDVNQVSHSVACCEV